jgi:hypothetical protein
MVMKLLDYPGFMETRFILLSEPDRHVVGEV